MNKWFISDTHFSHANIIRYAGRPFQTVDEMNERLIENWNALVAPEDTVFFLGDFGLGKTDFLTNLCARLHGNKMCIRGNHDGTPAKMHKIGFFLVLESAFLKIGHHLVELIHTKWKASIFFLSYTSHLCDHFGMIFQRTELKFNIKREPFHGTGSRRF